MQRTRFKAAAFLFTLSVTLSVIFSGCSSRLNGVALVTGAVMDERNSKYVEAEQKLNQALSNVPESNQTFKVANQWLLAEFLTRRKRYRDAEKLCRSAFDIVRKKYPEDDPQVAYAYREIADIYLAEGKIPEARELYTKQLTILKAKSHKRFDTEEAMHSLALCDQAQHNPAAAAAIYETICTSLTQSPASIEPLTDSHRECAELYMQAEQYEKAMDHFSKAASLYSSELGANSLHVARALESQSLAAKALKINKLPESLMLQADVIRKEQAPLYTQGQVSLTDLRLPPVYQAKNRICKGTVRNNGNPGR